MDEAGGGDGRVEKGRSERQGAHNTTLTYASCVAAFRLRRLHLRQASRLIAVVLQGGGLTY